MPKRKRNGLMSKMKTKQGMALLFIGVIAVVILFGAVSFSTFGSYDLTFNEVSVGAGGIITETVGAELRLQLLDYKKYGPYGSPPTAAPTAMSGTVVKLISIDNNIVCGFGTVQFSVISEYDRAEGVTLYYSSSWFIIKLVSVYEGEHIYGITLSGALEGSTYTFTVIGDEDSPEYIEDGNGDGGVLPTEPVVPTFTSKPDTTMTKWNNETFFLEWTILDDAPSTFSIYLNGSLNKTVPVIEKEYTFSLKFVNMTIGVWNVTCVYIDADANVLRDTVMLTITEATEPGPLDDPMTIMIVVIVAVLLLGGGGVASRRD